MYPSKSAFERHLKNNFSFLVATSQFPHYWLSHWVTIICHQKSCWDEQQQVSQAWRSNSFKSAGHRGLKPIKNDRIHCFLRIQKPLVWHLNSKQVNSNFLQPLAGSALLVLESCSIPIPGLIPHCCLMWDKAILKFLSTITYKMTGVEINQKFYCWNDLITALRSLR